MSISNYEDSLNHIQEIYDLLPKEQKVKSVSILDIFNKTYNENYISDFLAYIIDPNLNGVGIEPLRKLIVAAGGEWSQEYDGFTDEVFITREYAFDNLRRIDLLIKFGDSLVIGIEHKVFSEEHNEQTIVYAEKIKKKFSDCNHVMIFLTPDKREALSKEFKVMGYKELLFLLKGVQFDYLKDIKKSVLYQDFITHLEENFVEEKTFNLSKKTNLYLRNAEMIEDLRDSFDKDYEEILNYIMNTIKNHLENFDENEWIIDSSIERGYQKIYKEKWKVKDLDIHFELSISKRKLVSNSPIEFMIDIESSAKKVILDKLEKEYSDKIQTLVEQNFLKKYPRSRTFVSKEYPLLNVNNLSDKGFLQNKINTIFTEFIDFIEMIDNVL